MRTLPLLVLGCLHAGCAITASPTAGVDGDQCAPPPPRPRPRRPLNGERVATRTPRFRWTARGRARVELCDDRSCASPTTLGESDDGALTAPAPLPPGPRFWRVIADGQRSATRAVVIPEAPLPWGCLRLLDDFDGDAREDRIEVAANPPRIRVRYADRARPDTLLAPSAAGGAARCAATVPEASMSLIAAGDLDGDGFTDAVLAERWSEPPCRAEDSGQYVRRYGLLAGGPEGLARTPRWLPDDRGTSPLVSSRVEPVGDLDDDGYADLTRSRTSELLGRCAPDFGAAVLFGGPGLCLTPSAARIASPGGATAACDVDGDGIEELAARDRDSVFALFRATERRLRPLLLPARCGDEALRFYDRCIPGVERPEADVRPLGDVDGDGVGDVESLLFDAPDARGPRGAVTFLGAVGGFREDRCVVRR